ncbi:MAG: bifunctional oligoribonuclease/PAP phosphatase NrnA [Bacteroidota bacterium]
MEGILSTQQELAGMQHISTLKEWLASPKRIAITTHQRPDGDAIGSSLGLYHFLKDSGHKVKIIAPTDYGENLKWLPGREDIIIGPDDPDMANWNFESADLIFCLDFNALSRINEFEDTVRYAEGKKIMVDHHLEPEGFSDLDFWDHTASSTAEMVFRMITALGETDKISTDAAEAIYMGVMTDTGSFRFTSTTPAVHRMIAVLLEKGANSNKIHDRIHGNSTENRLRFFGYCLSNCLFILPELKTAYIKVDKSVFKEFYIKPGETEGLVNYALGIKNVNLGILLTSQDDIVKFSFRSREEVSASELAKQFGGGGHFYAAGARLIGNLEEAEEKLIALLEENKEMLIK